MKPRESWQNLFRLERKNGRITEQVEEEFEFHIRTRIEELMNGGMTAEEARSEAFRRFGDVNRLRTRTVRAASQRIRRRERMDFVRATVQDLKHGLRLMRRQPGFTAAAITTLGLGIGSVTVIFSVVYGVLLKPLPYPDADEIVQVWQVGENGGINSFSDPNFLDVQEASRSYKALAKYVNMTTTVLAEGEPVRTRMSRVTPDFLGIMGVEPGEGRAFTADEHQQGVGATVIVSHDFWNRYLRGSTDLGELALTIGEVPHLVVGVMPAGYAFPAGTHLWIPYELRGYNQSRTSHGGRIIGRLAAGVTMEEASEEITVLAAGWKELHGDDTWMVDGRLIPLKERLTGRVRPALLVLFGAVGMLLLIACLNVANLLLARATTRQLELSVRAALGAGRCRLLQQSLSESLILALGGGTLGMLITIGGIGLLKRLEPGGIPRLDGIVIDSRIFLFALAVAILTSAVLSLVTALRPTGTALTGALREGGRAGSDSRRGVMLRSVLVVLQVAVTLVLLVGSGLLGRSLLRLLDQDPGFRTDGILVMDLPWSGSSGEEAGRQRARLLDEVMERLRALPGVTAAGGVDALPLSGGAANGTLLKLVSADEVSDWDDWVRISKIEERQGYAEYRVADGGYFRAMGISLLEGRLFEPRDVISAPHAALISESLARQEWPDEDPIGRLIQFGNMDGDLTPHTIVGIVNDIRERGLDSDPRPTFYACFRQRPNAVEAFTIVMDHDGPTEPLQNAARSVVRGLDPTIPVQFRQIADVYRDSFSDRSFNLILIGAFSLAGLLLALAGIFGVTSYTVARQRREIGIRIAIGASNRHILRSILGRGLALIALGLLLGSAGAVLFSRTMQSLLYGVGTGDPVTYLAAITVVTGAALLAHLFPALKATRIDPIRAIQAE